jgi:hypothetical protein
MVNDLMWIELVVKCVAGALLALFPRSLARVLGLPVPAETLWPRLLGAVLLGLGAATFLEGQLAARNGLGLAGHIAVNLAVVLALVSLLIMGKAGTLRRGRILLGIVAMGLIVLSLVELAWV